MIPEPSGGQAWIGVLRMAESVVASMRRANSLSEVFLSPGWLSLLTIFSCETHPLEMQPPAQSRSFVQSSPT
jgi:hypothetical protein